MPNTTIPQYTLTDNEQIGADFGLAKWNLEQKAIDPNHADRGMVWWLANIVVRPKLRDYWFEKYEADALASRQTIMAARPPADVIPTS